MSKRSLGRGQVSSSRSLRVETLEDRLVLSATLQQAGISQIAIDHINNNPYSSAILADETLQNTLDAIVTTQTPTGVTDTITTNAGLLTIATGGTGKTYLIQGDLTLANGTEIDVPANTTIYVDGSIFKAGTFTAPGGVHSTGNTDAQAPGGVADVIFRVEADNVNLIGVNNAKLHSTPNLDVNTGHSTAVYIEGNINNVTVEGFEMANVWAGVVVREGADNVVVTNNYIHDTLKRAMWTVDTDNTVFAHNFIVNPGVDGIDFDAFTETAVAYENVVVGAGRWAGFAEEGAQDNFLVRGLAVMTSFGNPNAGFQLGWQNHGVTTGFALANPGRLTENNYFIDNVVFQGELFSPPGGGNGTYNASEGENFTPGQSYFWGNRDDFGAGQSATNFVMAEWLDFVPSTGGAGGAIDAVQLLSDLDTQYNSFTPPAAQDIAGDFDGNFQVDDNDLIQWRGDYGKNGDSDANGDSESNGFDFLSWQRTSGNSATPAENHFTVLDTDFTTDDGYTSGNLQFQKPYGTSSGSWQGNDDEAQVDATGSGTASSVGGPFDRNNWSIGASGSQEGIASSTGFSDGDTLKITVDYQFDLSINTNTALATVGIRDEGGIPTNGFEAIPQQGLKVEYGAFGSGTVKFFPDLADTLNADALLLDASLVGLDPVGDVDLSSDNLRISYEASTDGAGNWTVDKLSVVNLDTSITYDYAGPSQTFFFELDASPGTPATDAFYAQQLATNIDAGFTGTVDAVTVVFVDESAPAHDVTTVIDTHYTLADGYVDGELQSQQGWLGQNGTIVDADGTGTLTTDVGGAGTGGFKRNSNSSGAKGGTGGVPDTGGFIDGEQLRITFDYQFTLGSNGATVLASSGFRDEGPNAGNGFENNPQQGFRIEYNAFEATTGGSVKFFPDLADTANTDALVVHGSLFGLDAAGQFGPADLISDRMQVTYLASTDGAGNWTVESLSVENLDTLQTYDYNGPTQTFFYEIAALPGTPATDAFYGQQLAQTNQPNLIGVSDALKFELLTPPPLSLFSYETDFTSAEGFVAGNLPFQNGWTGQTPGASVDPTGSGVVNSIAAFSRNLYNGGVHGSTAGSGDDGTGPGFNVGDEIKITMDMAFTLDADANRALNATGVRENFSTGGFNAAPTMGFKTHYSPFSPATGGSFKIFTGLGRDGANGADNAFALIADGQDVGVDIANSSDFVSDDLQFEYTVKYAGGNTWTATEMILRNLTTATLLSQATVDNPGALESTTLAANDLYLAARWVDSAAQTHTDRIGIELLDPLPAGAGGLAAAATSGSSAGGLAAASSSGSVDPAGVALIAASLEGGPEQEQLLDTALAAMPVASSSVAATVVDAGSGDSTIDSLLQDDADEDAVDEALAELEFGLALSAF